MMIFLTGCTGLVGCFVARKFLSEGFSVRALKRKNSDLSFIEDIQTQIEWIEGDILEVPLLMEAIQHVDYVVHAAALVSFDRRDARLMHQINVEGTANIVNACLENQVKSLCHISSVAALGRSKDKTLIDEKSQWQTSKLNSNYAVSKYLSEMEVWRANAEGLKTVILNPSVILGPSDWSRSSTQMFKYIWDQKQFYTNGLLNYVDVRDIAEITHRLTISNISSERFILNAGHITYHEFFEKIARIWNKKPPHIKLKPWQIRLLWYFTSIYTLFTGQKPLITRETASLANQSFIYPSDKLKNTLSYTYHSLDDTLLWTCEALRKKYELAGKT
ncbi:MAG: NAD-dependent epimerase/dehydratase family protein [Microscillaceae bacterium]|nr:NAD-dependent epimerase/dehydratase family protein [Microscillaceae bacterium]